MDSIDKLHSWAVRQPVLRVFTVVVRVLLALAFVPSGFVKIVGDPFTRLPASDPVGFFFAGFFSAHGYYRFIGVAQWAAGALLLVPHTATIGAVMYFPIIVNIFAITVGIGPAFGGTRFVSGALMLGNIYLLCWDWDRWKHVLFVGGSARTRHGDISTAAGLLLAAALAFAGITATHLARLRHGAYGLPLTMVVAGTVLGLVMLTIAFRRAQ